MMPAIVQPTGRADVDETLQVASKQPVEWEGRGNVSDDPNYEAPPPMRMVGVDRSAPLGAPNSPEAQARSTRFVGEKDSDEELAEVARLSAERRRQEVLEAQTIANSAQMSLDTSAAAIKAVTQGEQALTETDKQLLIAHQNPSLRSSLEQERLTSRSGGDHPSGSPSVGVSVETLRKARVLELMDEGLSRADAEAQATAEQSGPPAPFPMEPLLDELHDVNQRLQVLGPILADFGIDFSSMPAPIRQRIEGYWTLRTQRRFAEHWTVIYHRVAEWALWGEKNFQHFIAFLLAAECCGFATQTDEDQAEILRAFGVSG